MDVEKARKYFDALAAAERVDARARLAGGIYAAVIAAAALLIAAGAAVIWAVVTRR